MKKVLSRIMTLILVLALVFAVTTTALADSGGATESQPDLVTALIEKGADIVQTLILTAIGILGAWVSSKLALSTDLKNVGVAWKEAVTATKLTVGELQQTVVNGMKAARADGKLTKDDIKDLNKRLIAQTKEKMSKPAYDILVAAAVDVEALIIGTGEAWIEKIKRNPFGDMIAEGVAVDEE